MRSLRQLRAHLGPVEKLAVAAFEVGRVGRLHPASSVPQGAVTIAMPGRHLATVGETAAGPLGADARYYIQVKAPVP